MPTNTGNTRKLFLGIVALVSLAIIAISFIGASANVVSPNGAFGGAPTSSPSPVPTPAFVNANTTATAANPVVAIPASVTNGMFCIDVGAGGTTAPANPLKWYEAVATNAYSAGAGVWIYGHTISNDEAASTTWTAVGGPVCQACYTNVHSGLDVASTIHTAAGITAIGSASITTVSNNSLIITACVDTNGTGTTTWGSPSRGTLRAHVDTVAGVTRGCAISDEVLATAGASTAVNYTASTNVDSACTTIAIEQ